MAELSDEQLELKSSIQKSAVIWSVILALVIALLAYWLLSSQGDVVRLGGGALIGAAAGYGIFRAIFASKSKSAKCEQCSAPFSTALDDRNEVLVGSEEKTRREHLDGGEVKTTHWVEEKYDVADTYECSNCGYVFVKEYQVSRRRDEISKIETPLMRSGPGSPAAHDTRPGSAGKVRSKSVKSGAKRRRK